MKPKLCEICMSPPLKYVDTKQPRRIYEFLTGRKLPWSDDPEIILVNCHPIESGNLCYYHDKVKRGLF